MAVTEANGSERFKLPGSSLDGVFKIVQGYADFGKAVSLGDVAKKTGMHTSDISRNTGFLVSLGLIEGGQSKSATEVGKRLGLALMHDMADEVEAILAEIVAENEFLKSVLAAVRIRKGMDEPSLRAHIAYSAGLSKTGSTTTGTGSVVDLIKRSGNLRLEDGKLFVNSPTPRATSDINSSANTTAESAQPSSAEQAKAHAVSHVVRNLPSASPFSIMIKIDVQCEAKDLDGLGAKLKKIIDDFSGSHTEETDED